MRVKSEARRQAIMAVAAEVFLEMGFDSASMSEIAARIGGSKATLYNYFSSKEELFLEVVFASADKQACEAFSSLETSEDLATALRDFGKHYLKFVTTPEVVAMRRILFAESGRSDIGRQFYERGPKNGWARVADFLRSAIKKGILRPADPHLMTMHLKGLYEAGLVELQLLGVVDKISDKKLSQTVATGVDVFMHAYGLNERSN